MLFYINSHLNFNDWYSDSFSCACAQRDRMLNSTIKLIFFSN
ncbi:hypothetical protein GFO_1869 [Christiangramia forsetii KT0803]|uniref:Uncharacterized protein n=1 Tax=Christiangramia forsetii (strain DSM 17595 / CGMCC 1.15422 / KT0803) TaxID=411154 RepID=A0M2J4_CHRFK|nr:hypothetical protein GFO_1869 [Christiangramia forsetii KT0803]